MINSISEAIIAGLVVAAITVLLKSIRDYLATNKILKFLRSSGKNKNYRYRSSHAISSETHISEDRVQKLCSRSKKIKRSAREKETWRLAK